MIKILLDTDIGTDIDDAVCLAYLLGQPRCELLGITTVTGEAHRRAEMASALCRAAGRDVPIHPGAETPLLIEQKQPAAQQADALGAWDRQTRFSSGEAVGFLRDTIRANPGEVILLAIGPLTNVALLFSADPRTASLLKGLVMMCGVFTPGQQPLPAREWNACCDPHAAAIVYRHAVAAHRSVGLDVTARVFMPAAEVRNRFRAPLLKPVLDFAEVWFRGRDSITFHDPLAAATIFDESLCRFESGVVEVETDGPERQGTTTWRPGGGPHAIAVDVAPARFFGHFFGVLDGGATQTARRRGPSNSQK